MMKSYDKWKSESCFITWVIAKLIGCVIRVFIKDNSNNIDRDTTNDWQQEKKILESHLAIDLGWEFYQI